jgi:hypothetical protein
MQSVLVWYAPIACPITWDGRTTKRFRRVISAPVTA